MRPNATLSLLLTLVVPLVPSVARAASANDATDATDAWKIPYQRCQDLIREGNYPGALEACERAYELKPEPGILVHIARIQTALLHPVQAHEALLRYLSGPLDDANRKTAEAQVRYLETLLTTLLVSTQLAGAEIRVDEQVLEASALARGVRLPAGAHRVTLQTKDATFSRFVVLRAGERTQLELPGSGSIALSCAVPHVRSFIDDQEVDAAQASSGIPQAAGSHRVSFKAGSTVWPGQVVMVNPDQRVSVVCSPPPPTPQPGTNPRGYWVTGVGVTLGVAALATGIYNGNQYDRWETANDSLRSNDLTFAERAEIAQDNNQLMDSIQSTRRVAVGLGISSALVTAGGVALLFMDSAQPAQQRASSWFRKIAAGVSVNGALSSGQIAWRGAW